MFLQRTVVVVIVGSDSHSRKWRIVNLNLGVIVKIHFKNV